MDRQKLIEILSDPRVRLGSTDDLVDRILEEMGEERSEAEKVMEATLERIGNATAVIGVDVDGGPLDRVQCRKAAQAALEAARKLRPLPVK